MSHPNDERDERVGAPERIWMSELDAEIQSQKVAREDIEYVRADIAATRMRDRCIAKMRAVLRSYELEFRQKTDGRFATNMVDYAVMELESLTLDQVEQEKSTQPLRDSSRCPIEGCGREEPRDVPGPPRIPGQWYCLAHRHLQPRRY